MSGLFDGPLIELKDIHFNYLDSDEVLKGIDLLLLPGDRIHLKGPNGVGKTTLLYLITGLLTPQKGTVHLFGKLCATEKDFRSAREKLGFLFQEPDHQLFCPTVLEDVCFGPLNFGMDRTRAVEKAYDILERLNITHLANRPPYRLSGGEKKLVALATILVMDPHVLLLDEPFNGLDKWARKRTEEVLMDLEGKAMIIVSHYEQMPRGLINKNAFLRRDGITIQDVVKMPIQHKISQKIQCLTT